MEERSSRLARLRRAVFARHSNPWSAWTRWATAPLVLVPVWTRDWRHALVVGTWMAVNPILFPPPPDDRNWATRAMLGEERWITDRPRDAAKAVQLAGSAAGGVAVIAAYKRRLFPAASATAVMMGLTMVYWHQMVQYYAEHCGADAAPTGGAETPEPR